MMAADRADVRLLSKSRNDNAKGEYYLTDVVGSLARPQALVKASIAPERGDGADTPKQLSASRGDLPAASPRVTSWPRAWSCRRPRPSIVLGHPDRRPGRRSSSSWCSAPGSAFETGAVIRAFSHLEGAKVGRAP
jgi:bifunctional UDP-N-acetylglucosamine pyrophosphorylase/glucosamine-1-phosphate N-acetyltransferase